MKFCRTQFLIHFALVTISLIIPTNLKSQLTIGITIGGIGYHPQDDPNTTFYSWKMSKNGKLTGYAGITLSLSYRLNDYLGIKCVQSIILHDSAGKQAGLTHIGLDFYDDIIGLRSRHFEASASFGPMWYYRRGWTDIEAYIHDPNFMRLSKKGNWESKFIWHAGQIQLAARLTPEYDLTAILFPGHPFLYAFALGAQRQTTIGL